MPVSAIIPTRNRSIPLARTLESLAAQRMLPAELIVIDGSTDASTRRVVEEFGMRWSPNCAAVWQAASQLGAAPQRNQGAAAATQPFIWFFDDDILFEPGCVGQLWRALQSDAKLGGVNAIISNQNYVPPGRVSRFVFRCLDEHANGASYAGRCIGPAVTFLPEDRSDLPEIVPVEWLNTTCTMYRREALPSPPFDSMFTGYSLGEDLALSLRARTNWRLANARTARIFHDSQPSEHKSNLIAMAEMELVNRHFIMTKVLRSRGMAAYSRLVLFEVFSVVSNLRSFRGWMKLPAVLIGKLKGILAIAKGRA